MTRRYVKKTVAVGAPADPQRIMKRGEVATLFGISKIRVDQIATKGILRRVMLPGLSRSLGFVAEEVYALLARRQQGGVA